MAALALVVNVLTLAAALLVVSIVTGCLLIMAALSAQFGRGRPLAWLLAAAVVVIGCATLITMAP